MARRVIRPDTDRITTHKGEYMKPAKWTVTTVYRIEWPNGEPTGTGLFVSVDAAAQYARNRGWGVDIEEDEWEVSA